MVDEPQAAWRPGVELRSVASEIRNAHDPAKQAHGYQGRCDLCHFTRHPCDAYEMADAVLELLDRLEQWEYDRGA